MGADIVPEKVERLPDGSLRCDAWRRKGGAFTLGPPVWRQCENAAIVLLTIQQEDKLVDSPACVVCWEEGRQAGLKYLDVKPVTPAECKKPQKI